MYDIHERVQVYKNLSIAERKPRKCSYKKIRKIYSFAHCKLLKLARTNKVRRSPRWAKLKISLNLTWSLIKLALFVLIPRLPHIYNHTKHQAASPNPVLCNPTLKSHCAISL